MYYCWGVCFSEDVTLKYSLVIPPSPLIPILNKYKVLACKPQQVCIYSGSSSSTEPLLGAVDVCRQKVIGCSGKGS